MPPPPESPFQPGNLVRARGREWVVQPTLHPHADTRRTCLRLRPLGGAEDDIISLLPELEWEPVTSATFTWPRPVRPGNHAAALLLRDALCLKLRVGAGPFRSFGNIAVEPRAYFACEESPSAFPFFRPTNGYSKGCDCWATASFLWRCQRKGVAVGPHPTNEPMLNLNRLRCV